VVSSHSHSPIRRAIIASTYSAQSGRSGGVPEILSSQKVYSRCVIRDVAYDWDVLRSWCFDHMLHVWAVYARMCLYESL